jgi:2-oxoglutarate ferredoxin oxidoreductase subunit alpha
VEAIVGRLLSKAGFYVFIARRYGNEAQGGNCFQIRVSSTPVKAPVERIDYLFLLFGGLQPDVMNRVTSKTKVVGDVGTIARDSPKLREREVAITELPLAARMKEMNCSAYEAEALAGITAALFGLSAESADALLERLTEDPEAAALMKTAFRLGRALGAEMDEGILVARYLCSNKKEILMDADTALSLGTAAGGCNFVASHSPFSGALFNFYSDNAEGFGAVVLPAEDKTGALNLCIGAAYAGARALFTTSDGCSAGEAIETANLLETPLVIHAAPRHDSANAEIDEGQKLNSALCSGHGEFPCAVYVPVSVESAFALGARAFATAEKFRTPVVLMADPYLSKMTWDVEFPRPGQESFPFSPSVPGHDLRPLGPDDREGKEQNVFKGVAMKLRPADKRMKKLAALRQHSLPPKLFGDPLYQTLIVFWGSLQETLLEALRVAKTEGRFDVKGVALLSCEQIHPLPDQTETFLRQARRLIFVEHNATGQFARLAQTETGCVPTEILLKYGEEPFSVEELTEHLQNFLAPQEAAPPKTVKADSGEKEAGALTVASDFIVVPSVAGEKSGGETP